MIGRKHVYGKMLINSKQKLLNFVSSGTIIDFNRNLDNVEYTKHLIIVKEDRQIKNYYIIVIVVLYQFFFSVFVVLMRSIYFSNTILFQIFRKAYNLLFYKKILPIAFLFLLLMYFLL